MDDKPIRRVVILGGGTAGWLSACLLAARLGHPRGDVSVTLIEDPDIPTIGVGEGTWPTMRGTLEAIGIDEATFLAACDASFKQGSRFDGWVDGSPSDSYLHPFTPPPAEDIAPLLSGWDGTAGPFAAAASPQHGVVEAGLAPRQAGMPPYAGALNYAYHLDAGKFARLLSSRGTQVLGVTHLRRRMTRVVPGEDGTICALELDDGEQVAGDLFLDCSGLAGALIAGHCAVPFVDRSEVLLNDRALAVQVTVPADSPIASATVATAHEAGWMWDIGLPTRRGIGCVYASRYMDDARAEAVLRDYVARAVPGADLAALAPRAIRFPTGHRERFWQGNCIAIGLSAGFLEPLEASAIVLIELSIEALIANFPRSCATLDVHAGRFNDLLRYRWDRVIEFLKLHYVLSRRTGDYWLAQRAPETIAPRLAGLLRIWREQPPSHWDFPHRDEIFSAASHQYVLYGMGFALPRALAPADASVQRMMGEVVQRARALKAALPDNRACLKATAARLKGELQPS